MTVPYARDMNAQRKTPTNQPFKDYFKQVARTPTYQEGGIVWGKSVCKAGEDDRRQKKHHRLFSTKPSKIMCSAAKKSKDKQWAQWNQLSLSKTGG